nr:peptidase dimerization domain-containing protein [Massilia sp. YIM B02787]
MMRPVLKRTAVSLFLLALAGTAFSAPLKTEVAGKVDKMYPWLDGVYKDLHAHPEIAFQEVRTAGRLAAEMRKLGFEVTEKVGRTGLVAILRNGAGPTVLVRTELDDGLFKRFPKPDVAFALHSWPLAYGTVGFEAGPVSSNSDALEIEFKGRGGHGSAPDKAINPIAIAARFIVDVQTVVSREKDPKAFGVVTIGAIRGGTVGNIIPDTVQVRGTIRSYSPDVRSKLLDGVRRVANASAAMADAPAPDVKLIPGGAAIVNDAALVGRTEAIFQDAFGAKNAVRMPAMTASEDFSAYANEGIPSMFFFTGVYAPEVVAEAQRAGGKPLALNHSPFYAPVPEPSIKTAAQAMSLAVLGALARP